MLDVSLDRFVAVTLSAMQQEAGVSSSLDNDTAAAASLAAMVARDGGNMTGSLRGLGDLHAGVKVVETGCFNGDIQTLRVVVEVNS